MKKGNPPADSRWKTITQLKDSTGLSKTILLTQLRKIQDSPGVWRINPAIFNSRLFDTEHPLVAGAMESARAMSAAKKGVGERSLVSPIGVTGEFYIWWESVFPKPHLLRNKTWKWRADPADEDLLDD